MRFHGNIFDTLKQRIPAGGRINIINAFVHQPITLFQKRRQRFLQIPPKIETAMQNLQMLRNQIAHYPPEAVSNIDANEYIRIKDEIKKTIDAIQGVPAVQLNAIAMIMRNLSSVIDGGAYNHITISEVHQHIEDETILHFIADMDGANELKGILGSDLWKGFDRFYTKSLKSIYYGYAGNERRKWGIENSGLCLVMAWTVGIIQMGSGWHPNENLSEL